MWSLWMAAALAQEVTAAQLAASEWADRCLRRNDPRRDTRDYFVCVDLDDGSVVRLQDGRADHPMPHQKIVVLTKGTADQTAVVEFDGRNGIYKPALDKLEQPVPTGNTSKMAILLAAPDAAQPAYARFVFPPSTPGVVTLRYGTTGPTAPLEGAAEAATKLAAQRGALAEALARAQTNKAAGVDAAPMENAGKRLAAALARLEARLAPSRVPTAKLAAVTGVPGEAVKALERIAKGLEPALKATKEASMAESVVAALTLDLDRETAAINALTVLLPDPAAPQLTSYAMTVEPTYVGAIRLGAAVVFGDAAGGKYEVGAPANASDATQLVVLDDGSGLPCDMELIVGYTHYLRPRPESSNRPRLGFFAALGIAELTDAKVTALQSIHAGVEFGWPGLSAGLALSVRNVTVLGNGLQVGDPVRAADSKITVERPGIGISLVLFPTPELWKTNFSPPRAP